GDGITPAAEPLKSGLLLVDEGDHDVTGAGGVLLLDENRVAIEDARIDHRIAAHFEREMITHAEHLWRHRYRVALVLDRRDRRTGRDPSHDRHDHRADIVGADRRIGPRRNLRDTSQAAVDDVGLEPGPAPT